jgi:hypothetical protein
VHIRRPARIRRSLSSSALAVAIVVTLFPPSAVPALAAPAGDLAPATPELIERGVAREEITEAQGALYLTWAFTDPDRVPDAYVSDTPWSGTLPLLELEDETLPSLGDAPAAETARRALRGATFACPGTSGSLPQRRSTAHFYIQYKASALQGLSIAQYASALETTFATEVNQFGWARPPRDPDRSPPGGRYPVRVENLGDGLYGYVANTGNAGNNPATPWNDRDAQASCMVLNRNYGPFPGTPLDALRATAAHEFNHSIQFGYGALTGYGKVTAVFVEGLAVWMEDEVFDTANDSYFYLWPEFTVPMGRYRGPAVSNFPYPYWVVYRAIAERFGAGDPGGSETVYQVFWEEISRGRSTNLRALDRGLDAKGTSLREAFHDAAIALRFAVDCSSTPARYCLEEGPQYRAIAGPNEDNLDLGIGDERSRKIANDYAINWFGLPTQAGVDVQVVHDGGKGILAVSVACRTGGAVDVDDVGTATRSGAAAGTVDLSSCDEASLVVSNVKQTSPSPRRLTKTRFTVAVA